MSYRALPFLLGVALFAASHAARADELLTVNDVERLTGLTGLQSVPKSPAAGAGGDLNFVGPDNKPLLTVSIRPLSQVSIWRQQYGANSLPIPELGPLAFRTRPGMLTLHIVFAKAAKGFWLEAMGLGPGGQPRISAAQLLAIARLAFARAR